MKKISIKSNFILRNLVIYAVIIAFFVGVIVSYYAMLYTETQNRIIKIDELSSVTSSEQIDKYLSKGIDTMRLACYTLDNMIRTGRSQGEIHDFLVNQSSAVVNTTEENSTGIYGYINGEYVDGTEWVPDEVYIPTERPWYVEARAHVGRVAVVDPYLDAETGTYMITFSKTLCDGKSVAAMDFSMERLQKITEGIIEEGEADVEIVLDRQYTVIAHSDASEVGKSYLTGGGMLGGEIVNNLRSMNEDTTYFSLSFDSSEYIVYAATVSNDWICVSVFDATTVFAQLRTTLIFTIGVSLIIVIVLLIIMGRSNSKQEQSAKLTSVVETLAAAIDAKDKYTNGHSGRVAEYSVEIARRYGYSEKRLDELYIMGLLHDVGKIGISDAVINKPGKLTKEEYEIIKTHPLIGAQILAKASQMSSMARAARWHHEHYDGTGYPEGLMGSEIPEEARIIAVADAYDAMTSRRSYRDILQQDEVRREIEDGKGTQFDPTFADIMLRIIDEDKNYDLRDHSE